MLLRFELFKSIKSHFHNKTDFTGSKATNVGTKSMGQKFMIGNIIPFILIDWNEIQTYTTKFI